MLTPLQTWSASRVIYDCIKTLMIHRFETVSGLESSRSLEDLPRTTERWIHLVNKSPLIKINAAASSQLAGTLKPVSQGN